MGSITKTEKATQNNPKNSCKKPFLFQATKISKQLTI